MKIELKGINKHFEHVHANNDIHLKFTGHKIVGILGENGAGKSTLMKILSGYQIADDGDIIINDKRINLKNPKTAISYGIGMLSQDPVYVDSFTVLESFIFETLPGFLIDRRIARNEISKFAHYFDFKFDLDTPIASFNIAQRQLLEIIRLISLNVQVLILDEPTIGISTKQKQILFNALRELSDKKGMLIIIISHKLKDVTSLCDEVVVMRAGRVVGSLVMPAEPSQLVKMMFGEKIKPQIQLKSNSSQRKAIIRVVNLSIDEKYVKVDNFSLKVHRSEVIGFTGVYGSGQELVIRALVGLQKSVRGQVWIGNKNMTNRSYLAFVKEGITFCATGRTQEGLIAGLTLTEHMALAQDKSFAINWQRIRKHTDERIANYNVHGKPENKIEILSGGNQQRFLMSLLPEYSPALFIEYPTRGLDVESVGWIWSRLLDRRSKGTCIIFCSSDIDELFAYSDRIFVFSSGHAIEVPEINKTKADELGKLISGD